MRKLGWRSACACLGLLAAAQVLADEVWRFPAPNAETSSPGLGGAWRLGTTPYVGDEITSDLHPLFLFEGKYLFARGTYGGLHLWQNDRFSVDAILNYRFNKLDPDDIKDPLVDGLRERRQTLEGGLGAELRDDWGQLRFEWLTDLQGRHDGQEARVTYRYPFDTGAWRLTPFITLAWQDADFTDYYYGVSTSEARPDRPTYSPGAAVNATLGVQTFRQLTNHVFLFGNFGVETLDSGIKDSPIVDSGVNVNAYVGAGYLFAPVVGSSKATGERAGEWSWRVSGGYAAERNVFPYIMSGTFQGAEDADVGIFGLTVGKLLSAGPRVDFYAKLALYRFLENDLQDDFFSYTGYLMGIGKGYLPWSEEYAFRWGFGFGLSYAEEVPILEQIKQQNTDENTSRLLAYMEFTVDVPIDRIIKTRATRDCFAGMTVAHRSGIFSYSDFLGNVAGGSDYITFHLECLR